MSFFPLQSTNEFKVKTIARFYCLGLYLELRTVQCAFITRLAASLDIAVGQ